MDPPTGNHWISQSSPWKGFHLIHNIEFALVSPANFLTSLSRRNWAGTFFLLSLQLLCTVVFHFRLHYWRKIWAIKGFGAGVCTCASYLIKSLVQRKKSLWDQSWMKDLDFSWRGKGELETSLTENSHKICKILQQKVVQCRGTLMQSKQGQLGPLGTGLRQGPLPVR